MLRVRLVSYVAPLDEQTLGPILPIVTIQNQDAEPCTLTGQFQIYRQSLGVIQYSSVMLPATLPANSFGQLSAETAFNPVGIADDDYFIMCDVAAVSTVTGQIVHTHLGPFYFDTKAPPMGPVPAGHHTTHENGGIDEVDVTGLSGLLADPQTPVIHGNAYHNPQMEEKLNKGIAGGYAGLPNPLDSTRPLRADGLAARPLGYFNSYDFTSNNNQTMFAAWQMAAIASGTTTMIAGTPNHPGILALNSAAGANSGYLIRTSLTAFLLAGTERCDFIFRPQTLTGLISRRGFIDNFTANDESDGAYFEIATVAGNPGVIVGKTAAFTNRSTTATSYQLITNTWYRARVLVNANATQVDYYLYDESGNLLWHDSLTTNIPTVAGQETGHGIVAINSGASAGTLVDEDYMDIEINRVFVR
jgi:hypothetical protein